MLQLTERQRLSDMVAERIRQHIVENKLTPGDRLPTEHDFAGRLGVSRLAVREATKALGFLGIVEASPRRGLTVGQLELERITPFLEFDPSVRNSTARQLIDTRIVLETGSLPHVMQRMREDPGIYERLAEAAHKFHQVQDVATWIQLDMDFHRQLTEASGLAPLVAFNNLLEVFFRRFRESVRKAEWKKGIESHIQIIESLRRGRLSLACQLVREHIESHRERTGRKLK